MVSLQKNGFYNYVGVQKFGDGCNKDIGLHLLKSQWKAAIDSLLSPKSSDTVAIKAARDCWSEKGDAQRSLALFPGKYETERAILRSLVSRKGKNDYLCAVNAIPRHLRLLYVHTVQVITVRLLVIIELYIQSYVDL